MTADSQNQTTQKAADTRKSVHLSASAGSGKTRALKERYLALLERLDRNGLNIDQAVSITFTDKAAAEIKERVMRDLPEATLKKIIRGTQDLRISTIHSFCMSLLKRYPLEAGLPPDFGVLDSRDQAYKIQKAIDDTLEKSGHDPEVMLLLGNVTVDELITKVEHLISIRSRLRRMEIDAGGPEDLVQAFRHGMEIETTETVIEKLLLSIEWRTSFERMEQLLKSEGEQYSSNRGLEHRMLAKAQDPASAFKTAGAVIPVYFTTEGAPRKSAKIAAKSFKAKNNRQEYENLFFKIQELLYRFKNAYLRTRSSSEAVSLLRLYLRAEEHYRESKLREGLLDFDDLEIFAYRLLQGTESPDILYWLDRKILHFLVDEFQDTSDIQWAILKKLTEEIFSGLGADKPMSPTLFVVGDEKQSIYRFREANYRLIHDIREQMERNIPPESREILSLEKNFRSTPEIIGTVNRVFSGLWSQSYKASESKRREHTGSVKLIEVLQGTMGDGASPAAEAEVLASEIHTMVQSTMVYERISDPDPRTRAKKSNTKPTQPDLFSGVDDGWIKRPASYGDCAVLIQSRTKLKEYEAALQARSIPYRVVGGIGFYEEDEIQALMNLLFFLWNRDDILCLVAALKSPLFGLTDDDIVRLLENDGSIAGTLNRTRPEIGRLLSTWTGIARLVPISSLIHRIVEDSCAYIRFGKRNPQAIFNIDKLLDTAREFDRRGYTTLQDFVEWVKNIRRTEQREATSDMNLPGFQGSVSIMTVHKAKGLEYPIVFLPGMNQFARSLSIGPEVIIQEADGQRRMAIRAADNPMYEDLWKGDHGEQEELRREHQRLLYVAMTRARDHLVMLGTLTNTKIPVRQNTWMDFLHRTLPLTREPTEHAGSGIITYAFPDWQARTLVAEHKTERQTVPEQRSEVETDVDSIIENMSPLPLYKGLEWKRATDFIEDISADLLSPQTEHAAVSVLTRGSVLHRCLEEFSKQGVYDLEGIMQEFADIKELDDSARLQFTSDIVSILQSVLSIDEFAWIFKQSEGSYAELPFLHKQGNTLVTGIIDRVVIRDEKGFVVDYKAVRIDDEQSLASWINHYRPQLRLYCAAVKEIFGLDSVEGYILFLDSNRLQLTSKA
jgi:ATP-dependent helicase/nuclease subunit A